MKNESSSAATIEIRIGQRSKNGKNGSDVAEGTCSDVDVGITNVELGKLTYIN